MMYLCNECLPTEISCKVLPFSSLVAILFTLQDNTASEFLVTLPRVLDSSGPVEELISGCMVLSMDSFLIFSVELNTVLA